MTTDKQTPAITAPLDGLDYGGALRSIEAEIKIEIPAPRKLDRAKVYICHPYSGQTWLNVENVTRIAEAIVRNLPHVTVVAPQLMLPAFMNDGNQREQAMAMCIDLALACDELWVCSAEISSGMQRELEAIGGRPVRIRCFNDSDHAVRILDRGEIDPATVRPFDW